MDWTWHPHPEVWVLAITLFAGYRLALTRLGPGRVSPGEPVATPSQRRSFLAGLIALIAVSDWPMHDLAEGYLYSAHMIQHLVLTLVMPPLLLRGTPSWLFRLLVPPRAMGVLRRLARPIVALVIFNIAVVASHWPVMVDAATRHEAAHLGQHVVIVGTALLMWMPIFSPVLEIPRLALPGQMLYLFLQSLVPTVPASFLTFGDRPLYPIYETFPRLAGISALSDMRTAGLIMKIAGGLALWVVIASIFFKWAALEQTDGVDALEWTDLDRTMSRMELK
jgi:putative membrane protein